MNRYDLSHRVYPRAANLAEAASSQIGLLFHEFRIRRCLSMEEVVRHVEDLTVETLKAYEDGQESIPLDDIFALANILNVSPIQIQQLMISRNSDR